MHEMGIAAELARLCAERCATHGASARIVRIAIGELSSVEPSLLEHAWREVAALPGRAAPTLEIDYCVARQTCARCGDVPERQPGSWMRLCPTCGDALRVEGGDELDLLEVVFDEAAPSC